MILGAVEKAFFDQADLQILWNLYRRFDGDERLSEKAMSGCVKNEARIS